uniref:Uncharacterized protein n=1 Tax=Plectus sambesii TaxID=2011161 RepID=A0A914URS6_9BILA
MIQCDYAIDKVGRKKGEGTESDDEADSAELELTRSTGQYLTKSRVLPRHSLAYKRLRDPTFGHRSKKPLNSIEFHPVTKVLLAAGDSGKATLFKIDGDENPLLQSANFERFPIKTAHFSADGAKVFVASAAQEYFHSYDLLSANIVQIMTPKGIKRQRLSKFEVSPDGQYLAFCGKYGEIHLLSAKSMEWVKTLKMAGEVTAMSFSPSDPTLLYTYSGYRRHLQSSVNRVKLSDSERGGALQQRTMSEPGTFHGILRERDEQAGNRPPNRPRKSCDNNMLRNSGILSGSLT